MDRTSATAGNKYPRQPGRGVVLFEGLAFVAAGLVVWLTRDLDRWSLGPFLVLAVFTCVSTLTDVNAGASKVRLSGVPIGLITAIVLLGPAPAAALGVATMLVSWQRTRAVPHLVLNNLVAFAWFPLVAGLFFRAAIRVTGLGPNEVGYYMAVFLTFV